MVLKYITEIRPKRRFRMAFSVGGREMKEKDSQRELNWISF